MYEETGDEVKSQGWTPFILDTNGNGKRDEYVEPDQALDPTKDKRVQASMYSVIVNPVDGSVWGTSLGVPGYVVRVNPGADPTHTALTEIYEPPLPGYGRAAATSIAMASIGCRWRAAISVASTGASARVRSTGRMQWANIAPKAGHSIGCPDRSSGTCRTTAAPRRATTPGSIGSTRSGWAGTCRSPRGT